MARRKRNRKGLKIVIALVLVGVAAGAGYLVWDAYFRDKSEPTPAPEPTLPATNKSKTDGNGDIKYSVIDKTGEIVKDKDESDYKEEQTVSSLTGVVTYAGVSNGKLVIRTSIDQYVTSGECNLKLMRDGATIYSATSEIAAASSTAACMGFDVDTGELGSGTLDIVVSLNSGDKIGQISGKVKL